MNGQCIINRGVFLRRTLHIKSALNRTYSTTTILQKHSEKLTKSLATGNSLKKKIAIPSTQKAWLSTATEPSPVATVTSVRLDDKARMVIVGMGVGGEEPFPYVWLRDNCQCDACFHSSSVSRFLMMQQLDTRCTPTDVQTTPTGIAVTWDDGHKGNFDAEWLHQRRFSAERRMEQDKWMPRSVVMWDSESMQDNMATDTFNNLLTDDHALYTWITTLEEDGIFLVTDVPRESGQLARLAARVAFLKTTNYGESFTVMSKMDASNAAYTHNSLGMHTDLPYYKYCPGIQMLHCISQVPTKGGENQFADGFHIAELMRSEHIEHFNALTNLPIEFNDIGTDYYKYFKLQTIPVISLNSRGAVERITYNNQVRDSVVSLHLDEVQAHYDAMKCFDDLLYHPDNHINYKLQPGEIVTFHNYRVLHGRQGYEVIEGGERHLEGGYIDWDELHSRRRVLQMDVLGIQ